MYINTYKHCFKGCFPGEPVLAYCTLHFPSFFVLNLCTISQQFKAYHTLHPTKLLRMLRLPSSTHLHHHMTTTAFLTLNKSRSFHRNHRQFFELRIFFLSFNVSTYKIICKYKQHLVQIWINLLCLIPSIISSGSVGQCGRLSQPSWFWGGL